MTADGADAATAVESLARLGLRSYEAKVFVGLQRLGAGTASEIAEAADVPRSQVYSAAEDLEERGLVEVHPGTPTRYRPVELDEARSLLLARIESETDRAFDALARVRESRADADERREEIWTLRGGDSVVERTVALCRRAEQRILYGAAHPSVLEPRVAEALGERAADGVEVTVVSHLDGVLAAARAVDGVRALRIPATLDSEVSVGRVLVSDSDTVLVSVAGADSETGDEERAFWTADTSFAAMLSATVDGWVEHVSDLGEESEE